LKRSFGVLAFLVLFLMLVQPALAATVVVPGLPPAVVPDMPSDLVMYLLFDEGSGNVTYNAVDPTVNNGTLGNGTDFMPTWTPGKLGYGLQLDGGDDYVSFPDISVMPATGDAAFSVAMWVKLNATSQNCCSVGLIGSNTPTTQMLRTNEAQKAYLGWYIELGGSTFNDWSQINTPIPQGEWLHIVATLQRTNGVYTSKHYLNGVYIGGKTDNTLPESEIVFNRISGVFNFIDGLIDEPMIFNRALSPEEIQLLYQRGASHHLDANVSLETRQVSVPRLDLSGDSAVASAGFSVSASNSSAWVPVPVSAVGLDAEYAYGIDGQVLTIDDNRYVNASSVNFSIPIRIDVSTKSELPGELYLDSDTKTFEYSESIRVSNPSDVGVMATLSVDPSQVGVGAASLDGSPMSFFDDSFVAPLSLEPGESRVLELTAELPLTRQEVEFRSTLDDFLEIDSFEEAEAAAENVAAGNLESRTKVIAIEAASDFASYGNRSVIVPLDVKAKDVIEARSLTGSKELLSVREGRRREGRRGAELVVPTAAFEGMSAEVKVIYTKKPSWWEDIPFLKSLGSILDALKKIIGG